MGLFRPASERTAVMPAVISSAEQTAQSMMIVSTRIGKRNFLMCFTPYTIDVVSDAFLAKSKDIIASTKRKLN